MLLSFIIFMMSQKNLSCIFYEVKTFFNKLFRDLQDLGFFFVQQEAEAAATENGAKEDSVDAPASEDEKKEEESKSTADESESASHEETEAEKPAE